MGASASGVKRARVLRSEVALVDLRRLPPQHARMRTAPLPHFLPCTPARVRTGEARPFAALVMAAEARRLRLTAVDASLPALPRPGEAVRVEVEDGARVLRFDSRVLPGDGLTKNGFWLVRPRLPEAYREEQERQTLREPMRCAVVVSVRGGAAGSLVRGHTVDLGGGGARLELGGPLAIDAKVLLRLALEAGHEPVRAEGRVLACRSLGESVGAHECRIAFADLADAARAAILRACFRHQIERVRRLG